MRRERVAKPSVLRQCKIVALVMARHVEPGMVGGQETNLRDAPKHVNFSKSNRDFMLQPSTSWAESGVGSERPIISR